jgi:hypothetical protein
LIATLNSGMSMRSARSYISAGTANHSLIVVNTLYALKSLLSPKRCLVFDPSIRVLLHKGSLYSYADTTVVAASRNTWTTISTLW